MKTEAWLFGGVAAFFAVTGGIYAAYASDPAGIAALVLACIMAAVISFFCYQHHRRHDRRAQDRPGAEVADAAGPLEFLPAGSHWPIVTAAGFTLSALGVVVGLWLFLIAFGLLAVGVLGLVFQYARA